MSVQFAYGWEELIIAHKHLAGKSRFYLNLFNFHLSAVTPNNSTSPIPSFGPRHTLLPKPTPPPPQSHHHQNPVPLTATKVGHIGLRTVTICMGHMAPIDSYGTRTGVTLTMVKAVTIDGVGEAHTTRQLTAVDGHIYRCRHVTVTHHLRMSIFHLYELPQVAPHPHFLMASFGCLMHCAMCLRFVVADSGDITVQAVL